MCVIGSQTGGGKKWEEGERVGGLPDWEVEGVVAGKKRCGWLLDLEVREW